jgi:hypothetical protein
MKIEWLTLVLVSLATFQAVAQSKNDEYQYQQGKIISIQKLPPAEGASVTRYNVSAQVGDTVYVYQYKLESEEVLPWAVGETQRVMVEGNVIDVKGATGEEGHYTVLSRAKANTQSPQ